MMGLYKLRWISLSHFSSQILAGYDGRQRTNSARFIDVDILHQELAPLVCHRWTEISVNWRDSYNRLCVCLQFTSTAMPALLLRFVKTYLWKESLTLIITHVRHDTKSKQRMRKSAADRNSLNQSKCLIMYLTLTCALNYYYQYSWRKVYMQIHRPVCFQWKC